MGEGCLDVFRRGDLLGDCMEIAVSNSQWIRNIKRINSRSEGGFLSQSFRHFGEVGP